MNGRSVAIKYFLTFFFVIGFFPPGKLGVSRTRIETNMKSEYRQCIDRALEEALSNGLRFNGLDGADVNFIFGKCKKFDNFYEYIKALKESGFDIQTPNIKLTRNYINRSKDWYSVLAKIDPYKFDNIGKLSLYISLTPASPGDYTKILSRSAKLFLSLP